MFIGVYAHRYGTIEASSGKSISEQEFDEASLMLSSGSLVEMLLYTIRPDSDWLREFSEDSDVARAGLSRLRIKASKHTCASFATEDDLLFTVLRDMYRTLGAAFSLAVPQIRPVSLPAPRPLRFPTGMEFLTSSESNYLIGRDQAVADILTLLDEESITLLLGDSGVGKTSLIHAGLIPIASHRGYRVIYTRPFKLPSTDIAQQVISDVFLQRLGHPTTLVPVLGDVSAALEPQRLIVVVDQFEDVLSASNPAEVQGLVTGLSTIRNLRPRNLSVLVSYRADLEARLGVYWQQVSGSPAGLPRVYLDGLDGSAAWQVIETSAADLALKVHLSQEESAAIMADLTAISGLLGVRGVYPPYVQMVLDHMWASTAHGQTAYTGKHYLDGGAIDGVVGGYLARQLRYAEDPSGNVRRVLISLVKSYGVKAQRSLDELCADAGLAREPCENAVERLIDLRLVRHIEAGYEVAHDFLARQVANKLVDSTERQFKRFRELLASKAAAFQTTHATLNADELLVLYGHRDRVVPSESESRLLLASWLKAHGPGLSWLLALGRDVLSRWLREEFQSRQFDDDEEISALLLGSFLGDPSWLVIDTSLVRNFARAAEVATGLRRNASSVPERFLLRGLGVRSEVRDACEGAIEARFKENQWGLLSPLRNSKSESVRIAYENLALQPDSSCPEAPEARGPEAVEFARLKRLAAAGSRIESKPRWRAGRQNRMERRAQLLASSMVEVRTDGVARILSRIRRRSAADVRVMLRSIPHGLPTEEVLRMLDYYGSLPVVGDSDTAAAKKEAALAGAIARSIPRALLAPVRKLISSRPLTAAMRPLLVHLLAKGTKGDLRRVLNAVSDTPHTLDIYNQVEVARTVELRMTQLGGSLPPFLREIADKAEFWEYLRVGHQRHAADRLLPLRNPTNRRFLVRLAGHGIAALCGHGDQELLLRLALHDYRSIGRAAGSRLCTLFGNDGLSRLCAIAERAIDEGASARLAECLRVTELQRFGVI